MSAPTQIVGYKPRTGRLGRYLLNPLSRILHGNAAGYDNNAAARRTLREHQQRSAATLRRLSADPRAAHLSREGYVTLTPAYDRELLRVVTEKVGTLFEDNSAYLAVGRYEVKSQRIVPHPERRVPELANLLSDEISNIVEAYFKSHFVVEIIRLWRNYPVPPEEANADHYSNLWHNDYDSVTRLRFFVLLTDKVTLETGAMRIFPISQTKRIMRSGYVRRDSIRGRARAMVEDVSRMAFFTGNIGSALFMNPQLCLHRAGVPKAGSYRDIVQFTLVPSPVPMDADWAQRLPDDPEING